MFSSWPEAVRAQDGRGLELTINPGPDPEAGHSARARGGRGDRGGRARVARVSGRAARWVFMVGHVLQRHHGSAHHKYGAVLN